MKFKKTFLLFLLLVFVLSTVTANASSNHYGNMYCCETVAQQAWYTKLIKLDNFKGKHISGTLNFELVPYEGVNKEYVRKVNPENAGQTGPEEGGGQIDTGEGGGRIGTGDEDRLPPGTGDGDPPQSVKIVPGVTEFSYKVPFSSEDYVDTTFNNLALNAKEPAGNSLDLFDHAVLHEWGRIETANNEITIRVGKLFEEQFKNKDLKLSQNEIKEIYKKQKADAKKTEYKISWPGDPDTEYVVGWISTFGRNYYNSENHLYDFLGDNKFKSSNFLDDKLDLPKFLNENENFRNGKFNLEDYVSPNLGMLEGTNFYLRMTTRPIAISKECDGQGNIKSIEKPLIPSMDAYNFIQMHNNAIKEKIEKSGNVPKEELEKDSKPYVFDYAIDKVFRYKLIEQPSAGIDLTLPENNELIVDVIAGGDLENDVYVFKNEESADKFYKDFFDNLAEGDPMEATIIHDKFKFSGENKVQLVNSIKRVEEDDNQKPTEKFTITVDPNGGNWNGNTAKRVKTVEKGDVFILPEAPEKDGYKFLYWKGSEYQPGDKYVVQGDHTFIAEWKKDEEKPAPKKPEPQNPTKEKPASVDKTPKTGDSLDMNVYAGLLVMMSMGVFLILKKKDCK